jgi:hypothetical protein
MDHLDHGSQRMVMRAGVAAGARGPRDREPVPEIEGKRWVAVLACRDDIDATLKEKARRLLTRPGQGDEPMKATAARTLSAIESEVKATLLRLSTTTPLSREDRHARARSTSPVSSKYAYH